jgi:hypothetical protein
MKINLVQFGTSLIISCILFSTSCSTTKGYSGTVQSIERGKDGYTATMKDNKGTDFDAVFSIPKLEKNYKKVNVGDQVKVFGDTIHLANKTRVIVTKIK